MKDKYICIDCASNIGATWREESRATSAYIGPCDYCRKLKPIVSTTNFTGVPQQ